jgi:hypothetical protein
LDPRQGSTDSARITRTNVNKATVTDIALASSPNEDIALASSQPTATAAPDSAHGLPPAALAGVVIAGVALVALSAGAMWLFQRRDNRKPVMPAPLRRVSMAARRASVRIQSRASHVRIETKEYAASGLSSVHEGV